MSVEVLEANQVYASTAVLRQKTLMSPVKIIGEGLFSGKLTEMTVLPAEADHGIIFQRMDLPGQPVLPAHLAVVKATPRCTILGKDNVEIQTVEHILSAMAGLGIDNALVQLSSSEIPIEDGSAFPFVRAILQAKTCELSEYKKLAVVRTPVFFTKNDVTLIALPSEQLRISYTLHYPQSSFIGSQFYSFSFSEENFINEIAPARTFCLYEEIAALLKQGILQDEALAKGLASAVVIKDNEVANPEGLRFRDEMVRHKILDLIGDLYLLGKPLLAHIIAIRSGHATNIEFGRCLQNRFMMENI